jgi:hypothetical protein
MSASHVGGDLHPRAAARRDRSLQNMSGWVEPTFTTYQTTFKEGRLGAGVVKCGEVRLLEVSAVGDVDGLVHSKVSGGLWYYTRLSLGVTPTDAGQLLKSECTCHA